MTASFRVRSALTRIATVFMKLAEAALKEGFRVQSALTRFATTLQRERAGKDFHGFRVRSALTRFAPVPQVIVRTVLYHAFFVVSFRKRPFCLQSGYVCVNLNLNRVRLFLFFIKSCKLLRCPAFT